MIGKIKTVGSLVLLLTSGALIQSTAQAATDTSNLRDLVSQHAKANGVPFAIADAVVKVESSYNPHALNSGNFGLMQIRAKTARGLGFKGSDAQLFDADTNLRYAMKYLGAAYRMSNGDLCTTLMRYQSGHYTKQMNDSNRHYCSKAKHFMANLQATPSRDPSRGA